MVDLRSKYILVSNPDKLSFWWKLRMTLACWLYPQFASKRWAWAAQYHTHQYMMAVHKHYEAETRQLNKAIMKKGKQVRDLQKKISELEINSKSI
jgi:hypothetical protein